MQVLTYLNNRGIEGILIASIYRLKGFPEAINTIFPNTEIQLCIVHQIRNSIKSVASKNQKDFMKDLKFIYQAISKESTEEVLVQLEDKWENLSAYFKYHEDIRRIIYTTNIIEFMYRQFRKITKTKVAFPNENPLLKLLYLGIQNANKKWTMPVRNWSLIISLLSIFFKGRLDESLNI